MKVFGITGWKNAGKTTLVERLVTDITGRVMEEARLRHINAQLSTIYARRSLGIP